MSDRRPLEQEAKIRLLEAELESARSRLDRSDGELAAALAAIAVDTGFDPSHPVRDLPGHVRRMLSVSA